MDRRVLAAIGLSLVGISLVLSPVTMADWSEQATFSVSTVEWSEVTEDTPVRQFDELSPRAQDAVQQAIESPDGHHTVYGTDDWPAAFFYSDHIAPGNGLYGIAYEGQLYELTTYAGGGFPIVYWFYETPFIIYGVAACWLAVRIQQGTRSIRAGLLVGGSGVGFHLLGPAFDFPVLSAGQFTGLGGAVLLLLLIGLGLTATRDYEAVDAA